MNDATPPAASLLTASAPVLVSKAIELALLGKSWPLKFCLDRIIAPQKDQPVLLEALSEGDGPGRAADFTAMMAAIASAAAEGSINPSQAATLCHAFAERARALETQERVDVQRGAVDAPAIWNRMQLRACVAIADGVREICEEGGEVDNQVPPLCLLIIRLGRMALLQLAKIEITLSRYWRPKPLLLSIRCRRTTQGIRLRLKWPRSGASSTN